MDFLLSIVGWVFLYRTLLISVYQDITTDGRNLSTKSWNGFSTDSSSAVLFILMNQFTLSIMKYNLSFITHLMID